MVGDSAGAVTASPRPRTGLSELRDRCWFAQARTSWRGPQARTSLLAVFRPARPSLRGVSGLLSSALHVRPVRAAVVTGASAAARFLWAVL